MSANSGIIWLEKIRKRWILLSAAQVLLYALAIAFTSTALLGYFYGFKATTFFLALCAGILLLSLAKKFWKISLAQVASFADQKFPELEDSTGLLLASAENLSLLQRLQLEKINQAVDNQRMPEEPFRLLHYPALALGFSVLLFYLFSFVPLSQQTATSLVSEAAVTAPLVKETVLPQVKDFELTITAPAYTSRRVRKQKQFTILAENGAHIGWVIKTSAPVKKLSFIWNDIEQIALKKSDDTGTSWTISKTLTKPGFYQLLLDDKKSDFYQVEIIPDQPVAIKIIKPDQHTTIDFGQPKTVDLKVLMTDDYGISNAYISATLASGKGEAVSFKEQTINFNGKFQNQRILNLGHRLLLDKLGMKPGDELYFYINATDNHGQQSRSDMYSVSIQDTTELMSLQGMDNGVNLVPEYFRSQRQIIIDTEKLLKERSSIADAEFKKRSNELGIDQKMLRLRYGKFLGEEEETNIGGGGHEEHEAEKGGETHEEHESAPVAYGDVQSLMDQYAHKHDQAEDATFFEPELKAQLKATLNEMWTAELRLRTYEPQQALPFEYKALRLLKDLQQKSRAYVAKTTYKTSVLKPEKRLTGELKEILEVNAISKNANPEQASAHLKASLALLESRKSGQSGLAKDLKTLRLAEQELVRSAASAPKLYLPALKAMRTIQRSWSANTNLDAELAAAEKGINSLLGRESSKPFKSSGNANDLSQAYFNQLKRTNR